VNNTKRVTDPNHLKSVAINMVVGDQPNVSGTARERAKVAEVHVSEE